MASTQGLSRSSPGPRRSSFDQGSTAVLVVDMMQFAPDLADAGGPGAPNLRKHVPLRVGEPLGSDLARTNHEASLLVVGAERELAR